MDTIVQWATILSPIIAVLIAVWTVRSSAMSTAKQILTMQQNTEKEIKELKNLAKLEIEALSLKLDVELIQKQIEAQQADEERKALSQITNYNQLTFQEMALKSYQSRQPERNHKYMQAYIRELNRISSRIAQIKENLKES